MNSQQIENNRTGDQQLDRLLAIAIAAGKEILEVYNDPESIEVSIKSDNSPITEADRRAHNLIEQSLLNSFPDIPVFSEESETIDYSVRKNWKSYWLVDPLDGTKEFVKRNGEFTVNIALVENGKAVAGVVHVPVTEVSYAGRIGTGAWKMEAGETNRLKTSVVNTEGTARIVASRSHRGELLDNLIGLINEEFADTEELSMGSSLKICLVAEGAADIYPRLALTSEWDTAAAHAVLSAAGGKIVDISFNELCYNQKEELLNPFFIVLGDCSYDWQLLLAPSLPS